MVFEKTVDADVSYRYQFELCHSSSF